MSRSVLAVGAAGLTIYALGQDGSMVISSMPAIGRGLGLSATGSVWLLLALTVPMIGLMLPLGSWADRVGNRAAFLLAAIGYGAAALAAGLAPSFAWVVGARAVEGCFASLLTVLVMTVASRAAAPRRRALAIGAVTAAGTLGSIVGPQLAALLLPAFGWRSVFLISPPLMLGAAALATANLPGRLHLVRPRGALVLEGVAMTVAVGSFFLLLRTPPVDAAGAALAAVLVIVVTASIGLWTRLPQAPAVFRLIYERSLAAPLLGLGSMTFGVGVMAFAVAYSLLAGGDANLSVSALAFTVFAFGQGLSAVACGPAMRRLGSWPVATAGTAAMAMALLLLLPLDPAWGGLGLTWRVGLIGFASGVVAGCDQSLVMSLAPAASAGGAAAVSGFLRSLFYSLGAAVAAAAAWLLPAPAVGIRLMIAVAAAASIVALVRKLPLRSLLDGLDRVEGDEAAPLTLEPGLAGADS